MPYHMDITRAFDAIGDNGASHERYDFWLEMLAPAISRMQSLPQREAAPVLALPSYTADLAEIDSIAAHIAGNFSALVVAGMGGSSLSAQTLAPLRASDTLKLHFLDNIDPYTLDQLTAVLNWRETAFLIISKSGNTLETHAQMAVLMRAAKANLANAGNHFFIITIPDNNPLHKIARDNNMRVIAHDPALGGRFSILSSVGLIPAAAMGIDIRALRAGAQSVLNQSFTNAASPAAQSAAMHMALMEKKARVNVLMHYCDRMGGLASWYRQCWGESLGKCLQASTPVISRGATDQHSQLQLYLDGPKDKVFTMLLLDSGGQGPSVDHSAYSDPRLEILKGKTLGDVMVAEQRSIAAILTQRGCPLRLFNIKRLNEHAMGALLMHFSLEVMFTAELLGVNAFDQPAVEDGKKLALQYLGE